MLFHAFLIRPEAGEATRGYLHGGVFIDFIGQKPVPIFRLLLFDLLILLVDFLMLGLIIERVKTTGTTTTTTANTSTSTAQTTNTTDTNTTNDETTTQDHDAEERGVVRGTDESTDSTDGHSHEPSTSPPLAEIDDDVHEERTTLLAEPGDSTSGQGRHPLDSFASGQAIILDMGLFTTIRDQWMHTTQTRRPTGYVPSPETATFLRQRFGLQVGADGRITRADP